MREFDLCVKRGAYPISIGATGYAAATIAATVLADPSRYFREHSSAAVEHLRVLADDGASEDQWMAAIMAVLKTVAPK
jgi:hypothetical protein